ncbi:Uncharacterised protein [Mycobacteroides abscessus subsp. abscessus]|nr:Uncharacterised protein [Mycobacteroides abscessus subsp. abscessus]
MSTATSAGQDTTTPARTILPAARTAVTTRRRPALVLGGIVLMIIAGLLSMWLWTETSTQNTVLQVRRDIARGETITATDIAAVTVGSIQGVSTVPADQLANLIGQKALLDLRSGSLLPSGAIGSTLLPAPGKSLIGLRLEAGRIMTGDVAPGSKLRLVVTAPPAGQAATAEVTEKSWPAIMVHSADRGAGVNGIPMDPAAAVLITVEVDHDQAELIAPLAAEGRLVVVKDSDQ